MTPHDPYGEDPFGDDSDAEDPVFQRGERRLEPPGGASSGAKSFGGGAARAGLAGGDKDAEPTFDPDATVMMPGAGGRAHLDALMSAMEAARAATEAEAAPDRGARVPEPPPLPPVATGPGPIGDDWDDPGGSTMAAGAAPPRVMPPPSPPPFQPSPPPSPSKMPPSPPAPPQGEPPRVGPAEHAEATLFAAAAGAPGPFTPAEPPAAPPRATAPRRASVPRARRDVETLDEATLTEAGLNPLLGNATALLALAARLRDGPGVADLDDLRDRVIAEVRRFDQASLAAALAPEDVRMARYALCATVDDLILSTEWGAASGWASRSLVSTIYSETWGGERFFDILDHLLVRPGNNLDVLELMAVCLALGFVGKYRVMPQGQSELAEVRDTLFRTLRQVRGDFDRALSPQWRGLQMVHRPPPSSLVPLLVAAIVLVSLGILYMVLSATLTARTEVVARDLIEAVPVGPPSILRPEVALPPLPAPDAPATPGLYDRLSAFLSPEIAADEVELVKGDGTVTIRLLGGGTFASATADVRSRDLPLLHRIAEALARERGPVVVIGHTDSQPIRTARFPSNYALSLARATSVVEVLRGVLGDPTRLRAEGAADREPLASNATREGRARNRRIEIVVSEAVSTGGMRHQGPVQDGAGGWGGQPSDRLGVDGTGIVDGEGARPDVGRQPSPVYRSGAGDAPGAGAAGG